MSQTEQLVDALKKTLKARGMTYANVAEGLNLSEASVKRVFSEGSMTLHRMEAICDLLNTNIYELARQTRMAANQPPRQLSEEQERALADDPTLLTYFYLLITGWKPPRIARRFGIDATTSSGYLNRLAGLGLIERQARSRVRLLTGRRIDWRRNGPVRRLYESRVKTEFLNARFDKPGETMRLESAELSAQSQRILERKIEQLAARFDELAESDVALPIEQKTACALLLALRPWTFWSLVEA